MTTESTSTPEPTEGKLARLVAERDRLRAEVDDLRARVGRTGPGLTRRSRQVVAALVVVIASLVFTAAVAGVWARRTALDTDRWVETVAPLGEDPAVRQALGDWMTTELMGVIEPEAFFESVLPERGQVLAAPLGSALRGYVHDQVDAFLASDTFRRLWTQANERAHAAAVDVLEGDTDTPNLPVRNGDVVIDLVPVLDQILANIGERSPEIVGRTVDIPTITVDDIPENAMRELEDALGRGIPDDFGQFTVFDAQRLHQVQDTVALFQRLVVAAAVLALVLIAVALWVSPHRRRTLLQLTVGIALGVVLVRRIGLRVEDEVVDLVEPENRDAVEVVVGALVSGLLDMTAWIVAIAAVVVAVALVTGPYRWAVALRHRTVSLARVAGATVGAAATRRPEEPTVAWVAAHREGLLAGGIVAGIVVLLVADLSWLGLVLLAVVVAGFELAVLRVADLHGHDMGAPGSPS